MCTPPEHVEGVDLPEARYSMFLEAKNSSINRHSAFCFWGFCKHFPTYLP